MCLGTRLVPISELFSFESTFSMIQVPSATFSLNHSWCSATHPSRTTKPKIRILGIVVRKGCVALHYSVHFFFYEFSLSRNDRNRGGGYRCKICTVPTPFCVSARPARENEGFELRAMCMDTAGSPTQPYKILYGRVVEPAVSVYTFRYTWP